MRNIRNRWIQMLALLLVLCVSLGMAEGAREADLYVGYVASSGSLLNPLYCNEWDLVSLNQLVFEPVVGLNDNMQPTPMLASTWVHEGDMWMFTLREGIVFHNGASLTAHDVVASYQVFLNAGASNPYYNRIVLLIKNMQAVDDRTLAVQGRSTGYLTLYGMTFPVMQIDTTADDLPRGTGPYWYIEYLMDDSIRIESNPLWWRRQPEIGSITFRRYAESGEAIEALQRDEVELISTRTPSAALYRKLSGLTSLDYATFTYELMFPNLSSSSFMSDVNVRKAVMYAIDRATIASNAYLDMTIQSEVPVLPNSWLYESQSAVYYYSPERALQLLYDAGWQDLTGDTMLNKLEGIRLIDLEINIITYNDSNSTVRGNAAKMIAGYLETVGIECEVEILSRQDALERIDDREYDLALVGVNLSEMPVLSPLLGTGGAVNLNRQSNDTMDRLMEVSLTAADETALKQNFSQIQLQIVERLPIMGLLFRGGTLLSTRSLGGLTGTRAMHVFRGIEFME